MKRSLLILCLLAGVTAGFAGGRTQMGAQVPSSPETQSLNLVASIPWVAGFAFLAGAEEVRVLAPYEMRHPPEYEIRPSDLVAVGEAEVVLYAGYERMAERLLEASENTTAVRVQVTTTHTREMLTSGVRAIAQALETQEVAEKNLEQLLAFFDSWQAEMAAMGLDSSPVVAHVFQQQMLEDLGVRVVGTFGPGPVEPAKIAELVGFQPVLVVDNWHNEVAGGLSEVLPEVPVVSFVNSPGHEGTRTLPEVFRYNRDLLTKVWAERR